MCPISKKKSLEINIWKNVWFFFSFCFPLNDVECYVLTKPIFDFVYCYFLIIQ